METTIETPEELETETTEEEPQSLTAGEVVAVTLVAGALLYSGYALAKLGADWVKAGIEARQDRKAKKEAAKEVAKTEE